MPRFSAAEGFNLSREIGVEGRKLNSSLGVRDGKRAALFHAEARNDVFRKQDAKAISDLAEFGLHRRNYNLSYNNLARATQANVQLKDVNPAASSGQVLGHKS